MKRILFLAVAYFVCINTNAQETIKYYDKEFNEVKKNNQYMGYFVSTKKINDSTFFVRTYRMQGIGNTIIKCVTFKDVKFSSRNGVYAEYGKDGRIDVLGNYVADKRDGLWINFNDSIQPTTVRRYFLDSILEQGPKELFFNNTYANITDTDSASEQTDKTESAVTRKFEKQFKEQLKRKFAPFLRRERIHKILFYPIFIYTKNKSMEYALLYSHNYEIDTKLLTELQTVQIDKVFDLSEQQSNYYKPLLFKIRYDFTVEKILGVY
jgi:hypothetical protein